MIQKNKLFVIALLFVSTLCTVFAQETTVQIIPRPQEVQVYNGNVILGEKVYVYVDPLSGIDQDYLKALFDDIGFSYIFVNKKSKAQLVLKIDEKSRKSNKEAYTLQVGTTSKRNTILVSSASRQGLLYAMQTLRQLAENEGGVVKIPKVTITDVPAFSWRAFMLDESRNFHGKEIVKGLLDEMARLKLNVFHWHLVDDPAWRIEIKRYPLLTSVASKGNFEHMRRYEKAESRWDSLFVEPEAQFYTQEDIKEIVQYADVRGITVIPEIEVPGHVSASVYVYPWLGATSKREGRGVHGDLYDVTDPKVEEFVHHVLDEIVALFPGGVIHIGGDEANYSHWQNSPAINTFMKDNNIPTYADLQVWAINRMSKYIASKGYRMIGWNEITGDNIRAEEHIEASKSEKLAEGTIVQFWDGDVSLINKAIEKGYDVVNSNRHYTYLDYPYEVTSFEKAYLFNPIPEGVAEQDRDKILGLGTQMWGEFIPTTERLYYQTFPRLAAYAENGWVSSTQEKNYADFLIRFKKIEAIWKNKGYLKKQLKHY